MQAYFAPGALADVRPPRPPVRPPMSGLLEKVVSSHESAFATDKLIKTAGFICGTLACWYRRPLSGHGPGSDMAVGLQQLASKCTDVRYALRYHGGYCGVLVELENLKNLSFLGGWKDPTVKKLLYCQSAALIQYYVCENTAYVT